MAAHTILINNITDFQTSLSRVQQEAAAVHSLSITIDPIALVDLDGDSGDLLGAGERTQQLWHLLEELATLLPSLTDLHSFSLRVQKGDNQFSLPRPLLATFLSTLPPTCTSLELDTSGSDRGEPNPRTLHLCETLRDLLPRLEHFRLDLSTLCPQTFDLKTPCPQLKTLTISCFAGSYHTSRLCASYPEDPYHSSFARGEEAMPLLIRQLQTVLPLMPNLAQGIVVDQSGNLSTNSAFYLTYNRRDLIDDSVTAMPVELVLPFTDDGDGFLLRTLEGDVFGSTRALRGLVKRGGREQSGGGSGNDRALLSRGVEGSQGLLSVEEWKVKYPRRGCRLWSEEKREGRRLTDARVEGGAAMRARISKVPEFEGEVLRDYDGEKW
ncbi:hypothetical protein Q7P35_001282 [Cladosporium inversicolor]